MNLITTPAFPSIGPFEKHLGLTKREYVAALCLQGMLAADAFKDAPMPVITQFAVQYADSLLTALEQK